MYVCMYVCMYIYIYYVRPSCCNSVEETLLEVLLNEFPEIVLLRKDSLSYCIVVMGFLGFRLFHI